ncbi:hypothetical protein, partial [Enterococcus faecium]|uniref:hypothetical protein n=1 Tax=Enterococcus faecium TaxID=1352 RepID=UPI00227188C8
KTSKVEKEFYLRCSYLTLSVLFDKEPLFIDEVLLAAFDWLFLLLDAGQLFHNLSTKRCSIS